MAFKETSLFIVSEDENINLEKKDTGELPVQSPKIENLPSTNNSEKKELPTKTPQVEKVQENDDWRNSKEVEHFSKFLDSQISNTPTLSKAKGNKSLIERSLAQWKKLDAFCSQALRDDFDNKLDINDVDKKRSYIHKNIDELENALIGLQELQRKRKKMKRADDGSDEIIKEAMTSVMQVVITPFEKAITSVLVNGVVSGGRNMEELYDKLKEKYKFTDREELAILQILLDMGYPIFKDRLMVGETEDPSRDDNFGEWQSQYQS
jgi:hypothetical protein